MTHKFGTQQLEKVEDAVQEALLKAMQVWGYKQVPDNPTAWLYRVAHNRMIDLIRKDKKMTKADQEALPEESATETEVHLDDVISDSQLKMIFACCHPSLSQEYQIILSLKLIGGFSNKEIAMALLKKEETVAKAFTRAKKQLKKHISTLEIPVQMGLQSRLFVVFKVIYLLFAEGYAATTGTQMIKRDICYEAIRLALLLNENSYCQHANLHALIALMCFHTSRFDARLDEDTNLIDLEHQDRSLYDQDLIRIGIFHLESAGTSDRQPSHYHLEAAISYFHCSASSFEETDWQGILALYNLRVQKFYTPMAALNRVIPLLKVKGSQTALDALTHYEENYSVNENALFFAIKAEVFREAERFQDAKEAIEQAIAYSQNEIERKHFQKKLKVFSRK